LAELAAVFEHSSSSATLAKKMAAERTQAPHSELQLYRLQLEKKITIKGFGLGLNTKGSDTLVARTLDEYITPR
jgi:hypothetical protein|tara:strand:+ start:49 stop:270 length:222 start_codon:yes stop_codon:yes gene_type:complete